MTGKNRRRQSGTSLLEVLIAGMREIIANVDCHDQWQTPTPKTQDGVTFLYQCIYFKNARNSAYSDFLMALSFEGEKQVEVYLQNLSRPFASGPPPVLIQPRIPRIFPRRPLFRPR